MAYTEGMMPCWKSRRGITSTESNLSLEKEKQLFKNLTAEEIQLFQHLHQNSLRLEQEQISNSYAVQMLKKAVGRSCSW